MELKDFFVGKWKRVEKCNSNNGYNPLIFFFNENNACRAGVLAHSASQLNRFLEISGYDISRIEWGHPDLFRLFDDYVEGKGPEDFAVYYFDGEQVAEL